MKEYALTILFIVVMLCFLGLAVSSFIDKDEDKQQEVIPPTSNEPVDINTENDPFIGEEAAPVEIINFSDIKCPWCANWEQEILPQIQKDFIDSGKAKVVFKNLPFLADDSTTAALAGEAIFQQNKDAFWKYLNLMFANQEDAQETGFTHDYIMELVKKNIEGLDYELLSKDIKDKTYESEVENDKEIGIQSFVTGTPSIFVNGIKVEDPFDYEALKKIVEKEL